MASKISGVPVESISAINGVSTTSISRVFNTDTSTLTGWPGGASCVVELFRYGRDTTEACSGMFFVPYSFDEANGVIYNYNQCGSQTGAPGFYQKYSDNIIYFFDGTTLSAIGPCKKK